MAQSGRGEDGCGYEKFVDKVQKGSTAAILIEGKSPLLSTVGHYQSRLTKTISRFELL